MLISRLFQVGLYRNLTYLPWDDDVDIIIDKRDESKLLRAIYKYNNKVEKD